MAAKYNKGGERCLTWPGMFNPAWGYVSVWDNCFIDAVYFCPYMGMGSGEHGGGNDGL